MLCTKSHLHTSISPLPLCCSHNITWLHLPSFSIATCTWLLHVLQPQTVPTAPNHVSYKNASWSPWKLDERV